MRLTIVRPLVEAAQKVAPVSRTAAEAVERRRSWATGRCLAADQMGIYSRQAPSAKGRSVRRDPSVDCTAAFLPLGVPAKDKARTRQG